MYFEHIVLAIGFISLLLGVTLWLYGYREIERKKLQHRVQNRDSYGYVYFVRGRLENPLLIKIGLANDVVRRSKTHRTANPFGIHVLGVILVKDEQAAESYLHKKFSRVRLTKDSFIRPQHKGEWFWLTPDLYLYIQLMKDVKQTRETRQKIDTYWDD